MTVLLDSNVLIALLVVEHVHHDAAETWLTGSDSPFATCPITQGSLVRFLVREGQTAEAARDVVRSVTAHPRHEFWPDDISYQDVATRGIIGHRQVTDAYLANLARSRQGELATFDQGFAKLHHEVALLVPRE